HSGEVRGTGSRKGIGEALLERYLTILHRITQCDGSIVAAEAELGSVLRGNWTNHRLQGRTCIAREGGRPHVLVPQLGARVRIMRSMTEHAQLFPRVDRRARLNGCRRRHTKVMARIYNGCFVDATRRIKYADCQCDSRHEQDATHQNPPGLAALNLASARR